MSAAGQIRGGEQLIDPQQVRPTGTILYLEPLYEGAQGVTAGSSCIANAYTSYPDRIASSDVSAAMGLLQHAVDAVGIVHAAIRRGRALAMPIRTRVRRALTRGARIKGPVLRDLVDRGEIKPLASSKRA